MIIFPPKVILNRMIDTICIYSSSHEVKLQTLNFTIFFYWVLYCDFGTFANDGIEICYIGVIIKKSIQIHIFEFL